MRERERRDTHDQFDGVTKGSVEKAAEGVAQVLGYLLSGEGQHGGQGDDGEEVEGEDGRGAPPQLSGYDSQRHEDEQDVDRA